MRGAWAGGPVAVTGSWGQTLPSGGCSVHPLETLSARNTRTAAHSSQKYAATDTCKKRKWISRWGWNCSREQRTKLSPHWCLGPGRARREDVSTGVVTEGSPGSSPWRRVRAPREGRAASSRETRRALGLAPLAPRSSFLSQDWSHTLTRGKDNRFPSSLL